MEQNSPGKKNALLGGLLVFIVPLALISLIYFSASRFPKPKKIPIMQTAEELGPWTLRNNQILITNDSLPADIKFIFPLDSARLEENIALFNTLTQESKTYPEFYLKEPYAQTYFIGVGKEALNLNDSLYHWLYFRTEDNLPFALDNKINVIDNNGNLRGVYEVSQQGMQQLEADLPFLLQEAFYTNGDKIRIKRLFKTSEELKNEGKE